MIHTRRLVLQNWHNRHFPGFAAMHADPEVMKDQGGPIGPDESRAKFERYRHAERTHGIARWAVETKQGEFIGYTGIMLRPDAEHPLGSHVEIGWRFVRKAWGVGNATESAKAALTHAIVDRGIAEILSYTSPENVRSQAVMGRLGLVRDPSRDFDLVTEAGKSWRGLVWRMPPKNAER